MSPSPAVDLVLIFQSDSPKKARGQPSEVVSQSRDEYLRLVQSLSQSGLKTTARCGQGRDQILIFIHAPWQKIEQLVQHEHHMDFLLGISTVTVTDASRRRDFIAHPLTPSERLRLVYHYITAAKCDGGLAIAPGVKEWPRLQSIMALHDPSWNRMWVDTVTRRHKGFYLSQAQLTIMKNHFGETVTMYFAFLSFYTLSLIFPSILGVGFFLSGQVYHPVYSILTVLWAATFVEGWKIYERKLSLKWGTHGFSKAEQRMAQFRGAEELSFPWWRRELRMLAFIPLLFFFAMILVVIFTVTFILEEFIIHNYDGPAARWISLSPTIIVAIFVPQLLTLYHGSATSMTQWENHFRFSSYEYSLTMKMFSLSALVAYAGIALAAFLYVPFHEQVSTFLHDILVHLGMGGSALAENLYENRSIVSISRVEEQLIAFSISNQVLDYGSEYIMPYVMRKVDSVQDYLLNYRKRNDRRDSVNIKLAITEERDFLKQIYHEIKLPDYTTFEDYDEMAIQYGFAVVWSVIWPIAPLTCFLNNWVEIRGDMIKMMNHVRRPIPERIDTIGPWNECLTIITWIGALTNSALVFMLGEQSNLFSVETLGSRGKILLAGIIALTSSHAYLLIRAVLHHLLVRIFWKGTEEEQQAKGADRAVKRLYLQTLIEDPQPDSEQENSIPSSFWSREEDVFQDKME